jgi:hypothetical protein
MVYKKARFIGLGIMFFAFVVGGFSMAQQALSTDSPNDSQDSVIGDLINPGFVPGLGDLRGYFSTRTPVLLYGKCGYFYAEDADVVRTSAYSFGKHLKPFFKGIAELGLYSIDAFDVEIEEDAATNTIETEIIFSVRQDQLVWDGYGNPYYIKKNDVVEYEVETGEIEVLFTGDLWLAPRIDGVAFEEDEGSNGEEEWLYVSPAEDWLFNSPCGFLYVYDEDIVRIPLNSAAEVNGYEVVFRGKDYGMTTLDAFDKYDDKLYTSVLTPVLLHWPPETIYAEDGDVVCFKLNGTIELEKIYKGAPYFIYTLDGLAVEPKVQPPE